MYTDLQELLSHKKAHCKLRFACKCHTLTDGKSSKFASDPVREESSAETDLELFHVLVLAGSEAMLLCSSCRASFSSAWDLMVHVQAAHMLNIYQLGVPDAEARVSARHSESQFKQFEKIKSLLYRVASQRSQRRESP